MAAGASASPTEPMSHNLGWHDLLEGRKLTRVQRPDRGAQVKSPARVRARVCAVVGAG